MDLTVIGLSFAAIFVVELPDKTFLATLVLTTKYRPSYVWLGVGLAFLVQTTVAVGFGSALSLLPGDLVRGIAGLMFVIGAAVLWRTARRARADEAAATGLAGGEFAAQPVPEAAASLPAYRIIGTCFLVLFAAEWGDLSQILTLTLAARYDDPVSVFAGAWVALLAVSGLAVILGRTLLRRVALSRLHYLGAAICLLLAAMTAVELLR